MFDIKDDYLVAGDALSQLLAPLLANKSLKKVYQANELSDVDERSQITPAAHLLYVGDALPDSAQGGTTSQIKQTWLVILACRLSVHERSAGELLTQSLRAIAGKNIVINGQTLGPFLRSNSPIKPRFSKSHGYYPLAFTVQLRFNPNLLAN
ncbi:phage tail terminator protein [Shewanella fidelis]|uniref:DUF3168 domain-containing protein n=1 Tax=Shewanella fidelis TaxID=173509 RepID=A0AAW8NKU4_9GAMM|nr:hypothetical protein [Shewanella fidelis]MDR8523477.1 hypothetical protein [Shewanella fidelis]MDW4813290.1 hypothetical protein [Shewanella fidelis]MDW4817338.1 hypothetical protein [Shewanella fidelis]MDW4821306.1 hypothetical protein [Shewanella fidelis]MDW4824616.1 hypothetical protein [Shewanella fidelis]